MGHIIKQFNLSQITNNPFVTNTKRFILVLSITCVGQKRELRFPLPCTISSFDLLQNFGMQDIHSHSQSKKKKRFKPCTDTKNTLA